MGQHSVNVLLYIFSFPLLSSPSSSDSSFPYEQPRVVQLLILLSLLFFLNVVRVVADYFLHAGIIAEIALGMIYGEPLAGIIPTDWEATFSVLGYLGLIGLVFEGGLSTDLELLVSNLPLSTLCAMTGIGLPVALSFALLVPGYGYTPLEAFAAGAALCSTSLGTTLMALNSVSRSAGDVPTTMEAESGDKCGNNQGSANGTSPNHAHSDAPISQLQKSRIGTVLISAAVIDDIIGLVLASLVPALSVINESTSTSNLAWTVVRPILSSVLMAAITPLVARFVLRPVFLYRHWGYRWCSPKQPNQPWGSSRLLKLISRRDDRGVDTKWGTQSHADVMCVSIMVLLVSAFSSIAFYTGSSVLFGAYLAGLTSSYIARPRQRNSPTDRLQYRLSFEDVYARTIGPLQNIIFAPLFFASIGYAIPFLSLWRPVVLWRGVVYALLMSVAKLCVGAPIVIWSAFTKAPASPAVPRESRPNVTTRLRDSVFPALFMGTAMVARGEIGLLIAQIARGDATSTSSSAGLLGEEAFLVCIWAILLCTLFSPIGVGYMVTRWRSGIIVGIWQ